MRFYEYKVPQLSQGNLYPLWQTIPSDFPLPDETSSASLLTISISRVLQGSLLQASWLGQRHEQRLWMAALGVTFDRVTGDAAEHTHEHSRGAEETGRKQEGYPAQRGSTRHPEPATSPWHLAYPSLSAFSLWFLPLGSVGSARQNLLLFALQGTTRRLLHPSV